VETLQASVETSEAKVDKLQATVDTILSLLLHRQADDSIPQKKEVTPAKTKSTAHFVAPATPSIPSTPLSVPNQVPKVTPPDPPTIRKPIVHSPSVPPLPNTTVVTPTSMPPVPAKLPDTLHALAVQHKALKLDTWVSAQKNEWPHNVRRAFDKRIYLHQLIVDEAKTNKCTKEEGAQRLDVARGDATVAQYFDISRQRDTTMKKRKKKKSATADGQAQNPAKKVKLKGRLITY
jgi:hypothetical protein